MKMGWRWWVERSYSRGWILRLVLGVLVLGVALAMLFRPAGDAGPDTATGETPGRPFSVSTVPTEWVAEILAELNFLPPEERLKVLADVIAEQWERPVPETALLLPAAARLGVLAAQPWPSVAGAAGQTVQTVIDRLGERETQPDPASVHWGEHAAARWAFQGALQAERQRREALAQRRSAAAARAGARAAAEFGRSGPAERSAEVIPEQAESAGAGLRGPAVDVWLDRAAIEAASPPPVRAFWVLGAIEEAMDRPLAAAADYAAEARWQDDLNAGAAAVRLWRRLGAMEPWAVFVHQADPTWPWVRDLSPRWRLHLAVARGAWGEAIGWMPVAWWHDLRATPVGVVAIALISGFFWWAFLMRFASPGSRWRRALLLSLAGLLLGAASTQAVLFWGAIAEQWLDWGYDPQVDSAVRGVLYAVMGIGLPEEGFKLLFFALLLPFLRESRPAEVLLVAGCVGLGFAVEENLQYFTHSGGLAAGARFLTANFFHMALTALAGFALFSTMRRGWAHSAGLAEVLVLVVVVHGLYDALLMVPALMEYSLFAITAYILIAQFYFRLLRQHQGPVERGGLFGFSLTSLFSLGLAVTLAGSLIYLARGLGVAGATMALATQMLGVALICWMFFREMDEPLRP